ncbi:ABC transporter substrate-binding protein [Ruminococcus flavefaciens]|uniref:Fe/B12 periplasmic-binding domain-containing protein n=1 Tax=Ruminococcus flavefaciens 007c TaxID=1341157 RepID=W7UXT5_RUMFL|nr:ABC transporter substrate-binding protein [Ruminococcus flavefaciens]EWM53470.1 hypothetical protein RF007C_07245 [Ruminococcus flavefaciens 007c]
MLKRLFAAASVFILFTCCAGKKADTGYESHVRKKLELSYAKQFTAEYDSDGCTYVTIGDDSYVIVPEKADIPEKTDGAVIIRQPVKNVYNAASSAMDLIDSVGALDKVVMTSTKYDDWCLPNIRNAIDGDKLTYIGKYSAPDYEALLEEECGLAIESTMIYHSPEVREQLEALGIPVLVERSSYETDPLGRMEWVKLYGLIFGYEEQAQKLFDEKTQQIADILSDEITDRTVAFFYINSAGGVVIRKPADYVPEMIRMAGGEYIFTADDLGTDENALSTMTIQSETFCEKAWDADILIYNSDITGTVGDLKVLIDKYPFLSDFKAVKNGEVWCTEKNMFQQTTGAADMIEELHSILTGKADTKMKYIYRLEA